MARGRKPKAKEIKEESDSENETEILENADDEDDDNEVDNEDKKVLTESSAEAVVPASSSRSIQKILIAPKGIIWDDIEQITLRHPRTGHKALFLLNTNIPKPDFFEEKCFLYEIMTMGQETRSWFVDDSVISDGNSYVCTPVDPLFFVLPFLTKTSHAKPLRDHLSESISNIRIVDILSAHLLCSTQLENIAIKKVCDDIIAFKYDDDKAMTWLSEKVDKTLKFLSERDISSTEASISSNFSKGSNGTNNNNQEEYLRYACEIVGEYLEEDLKKKLFAKFGLPTVQEKSNKRKCEDDSLDGQTKKPKVENGSAINTPTEDYGSSTTPSATANNTNSKSKTKEKEFQKAAKGSHSLFKFFTPKGK